jgi:hypothetical protein
VALHVALSVLVFLYWGITHGIACNGPAACAQRTSVGVSLFASLAASGCIMVAAGTNWPKRLLVTAVGASVVAVVVAVVMARDIILAVPTILLMGLPIWLFLEWRNER